MKSSRRANRRIGITGLVSAVILTGAQLATGCVDGMTPDCSDAAVCAPSAGELPRDGSPDRQETSADTGSALGDAGHDADGG